MISPRAAYAEFLIVLKHRSEPEQIEIVNLVRDLFETSPAKNPENFIISLLKSKRLSPEHYEAIIYGCKVIIREMMSVDLNLLFTIDYQKQVMMISNIMTSVAPKELQEDINDFLYFIREKEADFSIIREYEETIFPLSSARKI